MSAFLLMLGNYLRFDFGNSYFRDQKVVDLVLDKMPVSISLGLWTTLLVYSDIDPRWASPRRCETAASSTSGPAA